MEQLRRGQNEKGKRWQEKQAPQTIEIIDIECGLLSRVSQKIVATKRRIFQGKISSPQDILCKSKRHSISNNSMPQTHQPGTGKSAHGASQTTGREEEEPGYPGDGCGVHQRAWCWGWRAGGRSVDPGTPREQEVRRTRATSIQRSQSSGRRRGNNWVWMVIETYLYDTVTLSLVTHVSSYNLQVI